MTGRNALLPRWAFDDAVLTIYSTHNALERSMGEGCRVESWPPDVGSGSGLENLFTQLCCERS